MSVKPENPRESVISEAVARASASRPTGDIGGTEFPYKPESVGTARHALADALQRMRVAPSVADDAILILSELVSNALRHALPLDDGTIRVAWWMEDSNILRIAVTDGGRQQSCDPTPTADGEGMDLAATDLEEVDESAVDGRGLGIVGLLADSWGVEPWGVSGTESATGPTPEHDPSAPKTVWAAVRLHARHAAPEPPEDDDRRWWGRLRLSLTTRWPGAGRERVRGARLSRPRLGAAKGGAGGGGGRRGVDAVGADSAWVPRYPAVARRVGAVFPG